MQSKSAKINWRFLKVYDLGNVHHRLQQNKFKWLDEAEQAERGLISQRDAMKKETIRDEA